MSRRWLTAAVFTACQQSSVPVRQVPPTPGEVLERADEGYDAQRAAAEVAEAEWYEGDPERVERVAALPLPQGDACKVAYSSDVSAFMVGGIPVFFPFDEETDSTAVGEQAHIFNARRGDTLYVAFGDDRVTALAACGTGPMAPSDTLWTIDCTKRPLRPQRFYAPPDDSRLAPDFGNAVVAETGDALYVMMSGGLGRFSLRDKSLVRVLDAPPCSLTTAAWNLGNNNPCSTVLFPLAPTPDGLEIIVAEPEQSCVDMGIVQPRYLVDLTSDEVRANPHAWRRPVRFDFLHTSGSTWFLGASAEGGSAFDNAFWRSTDAGQSWEPIRVDAGEDHRVTGISAVLVDKRHPKRMLARSVARQNSAAGFEFSDELFVTRDGGKRWTFLDLGEGEVLRRLWTADGSLDHLYITRGEADGAHTAFESRDGGATWKPSDVTPPAESKVIPPEGFALGPLGLWRVVPDAAGEAKRSLVFPPPNLLAPLSVHGRPIAPTPWKAISWSDYDRASVANQRGLELAKAKQFEAAIKAYEEAWAINPNNAYARYNAACAHALLGDTKQAMALLEALHTRRGHRELALLEAAASDNDLVSLRGLPRFRLLTIATPPTPAYDFAFSNPDEHGDWFTIADAVMSDRDEQICLWATSIEAFDGVVMALDRFDCRTGAAQGQLRGNAKQLMAALDDLGMRAWTSIKDTANEEGEAPSETPARRWATSAAAKVLPPDTDAAISVFRSPSGKRVAARVTYAGSSGDAQAKLVFGDWP